MSSPNIPNVPFSLQIVPIQDGFLKGQKEVILLSTDDQKTLLPPFFELHVEESRFALLGEHMIKETALFHDVDIVYDLVHRMIRAQAGKTTKEKARRARDYYEKQGFMTSIHLNEIDATRMFTCMREKGVLDETADIRDVVALYDIIESNGFGVMAFVNETSLGQAFFAGTAMRFNHSCDPNCSYYFSFNDVKDTLNQTKIHIYALRPIQVGEPLTINYIRNAIYYNTKGERRTFLSQSLGFECHCPRCENKDEAPDQADFMFDLLGPDLEHQTDFIQRLETFVKMRDAFKREQRPAEVAKVAIPAVKQILRLWLDVLGSVDSVSQWSLLTKKVKGSRVLWYNVARCIMSIAWTSDTWAYFESMFPVLKDKKGVLKYMSMVASTIQLDPPYMIALMVWLLGPRLKPVLNVPDEKKTEVYLYNSKICISMLKPLLVQAGGKGGKGYDDILMRAAVFFSDTCKLQGILEGEPNRDLWVGVAKAFLAFIRMYDYAKTEEEKETQLEGKQ